MGALWRVMVREWRRIVTYKVYWLCMIGMPLLGVFFFGTMLYAGLPERIPTAVVDMDNSESSRRFVAKLQAQQSIDIVLQPHSFREARDAMQRGIIYGFLVIPSRFESLALDGKQPTITFYTNDAYLIPGSLLYESYVTQSMLLSASVVEEVLLSLGITERRIETLLQPLSIDLYALGNPWLNYSVYLSNSFIPTILQLMTMLVFIYALTGELKQGSVRSWLLAARGSFAMALVGKWVVYTTLFVLVGVSLQLFLYGYMQFPLHCSMWRMVAAMALMVLAAQSIVIVILSVVPNLSIAYSAVSVVGVVSFSLGGFSFPVSNMYVPFQFLTNLLPVRHYFLIYANSALNGYPLYYCRSEFVALLLMIGVALISIPRLHRVILNYAKR